MGLPRVRSVGSYLGRFGQEIRSNLLVSMDSAARYVSAHDSNVFGNLRFARPAVEVIVQKPPAPLSMALAFKLGCRPTFAKGLDATASLLALCFVPKLADQ
jgi:hypothetical protein